ncbi:gluconate 2-dehydrogenase subunit 3 family protein [Ureibacillus aquaedulcis]|uniref:Gluconate 2-dehydrogenase subunit 3 family protein n=1 Tax=Ureibacillus aquaedulcis TaxID=3058421 RepID=A0ABT8GU84_9BACL|nr:gluconate 2-dehydrogenase subunit 3 family protein [Ureibacillus sp. BA0131]MDN4494963.1 gluconate 2-dehydrogenase subunit 3 family protein [Ureibacillus sp. BA0131]
MSEQDKNGKKEPTPEKRSSRRQFLKNSGLTVGGLVVGGALGSLFGKDTATQTTTVKEEQQAAAPATDNANRALMFFTPDQFDIANAAVERIFPADELGPGAQELLVAYFIDHQLASGWGIGAKEYTSGPYYPGEKTQGYQGRLNRQEIFAIGLEAIESHSIATFDKSFIELTEEQQDQVLTDFDDGNVEMKGVSSDFFFSLLRSTTIEGVYADPLYGGNANMEGWKMRNFPGHQMSYFNLIDQDEYEEIEPKSLSSQHNH